MSTLALAGQRRRVAVAVVAALVVIFLAASIATQVGDLQRFDWHFEPAWLALSVGLLIAFEAVSGLLWVSLVRAAGGELPAAPGLRIFSIALITRYVPTQILMAVTRWALLAAPVVLLLALHPRVIDTLVGQLAARLGAAPEHVSLPSRKLVVFMVAYVGSFLIAGVAVYAFARSVHPTTPFDLRVLSSYAIGYSAAVLAFFIPGGLGARDGATATALAAVMPGRVAVAVAIGIRLLQTLVELGYVGALELWHRRQEARAC
jgi:hypothetical protein